MKVRTGSRPGIRAGAAIAAVALVGAGLAGCSSSSDSRSAAPAPSDSMQGSNVRPDAPPLMIMQADNGSTINLVPGQIGCFGDIPKDNYTVTSSDESVVEGAGGLVTDDGTECSPAILANAVGTTKILVSESGGDPVLQFDVEVIPAD